MIPSDSELVEYFYGESERAAEIEQALASSPELARRYESLRRILLAVEAPEAPARGEVYGEELWQRLQPAIAERSRMQNQRSWIWTGMAAAAVFALLLGAFVLGRQQGHEKGREEVIAEGLSKESRDRILLATAIDHLDRAQVLLVTSRTRALVAYPISISSARAPPSSWCRTACSAVPLRKPALR